MCKSQSRARLRDDFWSKRDDILIGVYVRIKFLINMPKRRSFVCVCESPLKNDLLRPFTHAFKHVN